MKGYGQFCPVSKCAEILGERWMLLLVRELLMGSTRFTQLKRGLGRISPSVLSDRLRTLEDNDIIYREPSPGEGYEYHLTECGRALKPVIDAAGLWGYHWIRTAYSAEDLDVDLLMLDISRRVRLDKINARRAVIEFEFTDLQKPFRSWWLLIEDGSAETCHDHPGRPADLVLRCTMETMARIWMGRLDLAGARRNGLLKVEGSRRLSSNLGTWLSQSYVAELARSTNSAE